VREIAKVRSCNLRGGGEGGGEKVLVDGHDGHSSF
jgi:hypothetical protein